jgi:aminopeptidase-like protein
MQCKCEPQLGKRGLYPTISRKGVYDSVRVMQHFTAYADGRNDLIDISNILNTPVDELIPLKDKLMEHHLLAIK